MGKKSREKRDRPRRINIPPPKHAAITEAVCERDRQFFEEHPGESHYLRPYVPGEFPIEVLSRMGAPMPKQDAWILVTQIVPGTRMRRDMPAMPDMPRGSRFRIFQSGSPEPIEAWVEPWPTTYREG